MSSSQRADVVKAFAMTNMLLEADLDRIEGQYDVDLGRHTAVEAVSEGPYYAQFEERLRNEARSMAGHYELFYCHEQSIRELIKGRLRGIW